jgi:hypothetical protein
MTGTVPEDQYTFLIISHSILLIMRNFSDKSRREIKICILCSVVSTPPQNHAVYETIWKNVESDRQQMTIWACALRDLRLQNTHSKYVTLIALTTATMVTRTPVIVKVLRTFPLFLPFCRLFNCFNILFECSCQ